MHLLPCFHQHLHLCPQKESLYLRLHLTSLQSVHHPRHLHLPVKYQDVTTDSHKQYQCMLIKGVLSEMITSAADCFWSNLKWTRKQHKKLYPDYILKKCDGCYFLIPTKLRYPDLKFELEHKAKRCSHDNIMLCLACYHLTFVNFPFLKSTL